MFWCDEINERVNAKLARMQMGERRVNAMRRRFKEANRRVDKAIKRYKNFVAGCWVENAQGELVDAYSVACRYYDRAWHFHEFISEFSEDIFRRGRGQKRLAEIWGRMAPVTVKRVDIAAVKKLEAAIESACDKRERLIRELSSIGIDVWDKSEKDLWQ